MDSFKLLIVEDNEGELETCRNTVSRYMDQNNCNIEIVECSKVEEAYSKLDNTIDGAIIDLRLDKGGDEGNLVVKRIDEAHFRIPVAILTGTPDAVDHDFDYIGVFKKGEAGAGYSDLLDLFLGIHRTGLTRIMGGRGIIEETLNKVFRGNLLPQRNKWVEYGNADSSRTEKALLRYALSHLLQLLDDDNDRCYPEEVYLSPPLTDKIRTGSIITENNSDKRFVVMNPACDLVIRQNEQCNTDRVLIVEIDLESSIFPGFPDTGLSRSQKEKLERAYKNNKQYYHWLPRTDYFEGGFLNFRKLLSLSHPDFDERFNKPKIQIAPYFVKDIIARFSAYYARQGQPDIDFASLIER